MFNTLYSIAGGIALAVGALGASDDFDGSQLAQNAFFGPEEESVVLNEQETATDEVQVAHDVLEWDEIASKVLGMSLTGSDELTDDEKLEFEVLTGEIPSDVSDNQDEVKQITENSQPEGLSEEEFYCMLKQQYDDAMSVLKSEPLVIESVTENEPTSEEIAQETKKDVIIVEDDNLVADIVFQATDDNNVFQAPDDNNVEKAEQTEDDSQGGVEIEPWIISHDTLPDIPEKDMAILTGQAEKKEQPVQTEQTVIENVDVQNIPDFDIVLLDVPDVEAPELEENDLPLFVDSDNDSLEIETVEAKEVETEDADVEQTEAEEAEAENADVEQTEAEEAEAEDADVEQTEAEEAETENADVEQTEAEEAEAEDADSDVEVEDFFIEPLDIDVVEIESNDDVLVIPSTEIPPAVITEEQRAKISAEVDAIVEQNDNFSSWIPRQIPVSGSVEDAQPQTKPEEDFIQNFSRQNVKESILENTGVKLND